MTELAAFVTLSLLKQRTAFAFACIRNKALKHFPSNTECVCVCMCMGGGVLYAVLLLRGRGCMFVSVSQLDNWHSVELPTGFQAINMEI